MEITSNTYTHVAVEPIIDNVEKQPIPENNYSEDTKVITLSFMAFPEQGKKLLADSLAMRKIQILQEKSTATKVSRTREIWFPTRDKKIVKEIYVLGLIALKNVFFRQEPTNRNSDLYDIAKGLYEFKKSHPKEFNIALPGLKSRDVKLICNSLAGYASFWDVVDGIYDQNADAIEHNVKRTVKYMINCGASADDLSIKKFQEGCLDAAQQLRAKPAVAPAA